MSQGAVPIGMAVAILLVILISVVATARRARRFSEERATRAMERGWTYIKGAKSQTAYALEGRDEGVSWRLESKAIAKNRSRSEWRTADLPSGGGTVAVMEKAQAGLFKSDFVRKVAGWGLGLVPDSDPRKVVVERLLEGNVEVDTGDAEFHALYTVLATDAGPAHRLVTAEVRRAMLDWRAVETSGARSWSLDLVWSEEGLSLAWPMALESGGAMVRFVELGLSIVRTQKGSWG